MYQVDVSKRLGIAKGNTLYLTTLIMKIQLLHKCSMNLMLRLFK